jgi:putative DNA primase/helicase
VQPVLYNLPEVLAATHVIVCEGEKDADSISRLELKTASGLPIAATTNPDGAGCWKDEFSIQLAGKRVLVIPDSDDAGIEHGDEVLMSVREHAPTAESDIRLIPNWDIKDISDFLEHHTREEMIEMIGLEWFGDVGMSGPSGSSGSPVQEENVFIPV